MVGLAYHSAWRSEDGAAITETRHFWANLPISGKKYSWCETEENTLIASYSSDLCLKGSDQGERSGRRACTCSPSPARSCGGWRHPGGSAARQSSRCQNPPGWFSTSYFHAEDEWASPWVEEKLINTVIKIQLGAVTDLICRTEKKKKKESARNLAPNWLRHHVSGLKPPFFFFIYFY